MTEQEQFDLIVTPAAGSVASNIADLEAWIKKVSEPYIGQVVTEDQVKFAKKDLAVLRKLKTALEDERKKAKAIIMAPYTDFEMLYKKAIASLDSAISGIDIQVKEIEAAAKEKKRRSIEEFIKTEAKNLRGESLLIKMEREDVMSWFLEPKWLNASETDTSVQLAVREKLVRVSRDLDCILKTSEQGIGGPAAFDEYYRTGSLSAALDKKMQVEAIQKQQEAEAAAAKQTETPIQAAPPAAPAPSAATPKQIAFTIPDEPDDPSLKKWFQLPVVLVFPKYKLPLIKDIASKLGIKILKPNQKEA